MRVPRRIANKIRRIQDTIHRAGGMNSELVTMTWTEETVPPGYDPNLETSPQPTVQAMTQEARAFVHYVNIQTTGYAKFAQVRHGDVILDFMGDVEIDGKRDMRFEVGGKVFVQKDGGNELAESWDVRCNGIPVTRTVLVSPL